VEETEKPFRSTNGIPLREFLEQLVSGLEDRVMDKFASEEKAVMAALTAQDKLTSAAFASSEKSIQKAEEAQRVYDHGHNDLIRKMDDQYSEMMPRSEAISLHKATEEKLEQLRVSVDAKIDIVKGALDRRVDEIKLDIRVISESISKYSARYVTAAEDQLSARQQKNWSIGIIVLIGSTIIGWGLVIIGLMLKMSGKG